jgi:hypothetical protein
MSRTRSENTSGERASLEVLGLLKILLGASVDARLSPGWKLSRRLKEFWPIYA